MNAISISKCEIETLRKSLEYYRLSLEKKYFEFTEYDCTFIMNKGLLNEIRLNKENLQANIALLMKIDKRILELETTSYLMS